MACDSVTLSITPSPAVESHEIWRKLTRGKPLHKPPLPLGIVILTPSLPSAEKLRRNRRGEERRRDERRGEERRGEERQVKWSECKSLPIDWERGTNGTGGEHKRVVRRASHGAFEASPLP